MRNKNRRWLFVWAMMYSVMGILQCEFVKNSTNMARHSTENATKLQELRSVFSPRMDYEQWTPIGRGDPLKNDPTYDYVPPVLDRVHYWVDPSSRKPDPQLAVDANAANSGSTNSNDNANNQKTEILVLGVSSKKPSLPPPPTPVASADARRDVYDPYMKYVDNSAPKYQQNHYQRERIYYPYSHYFPSSSMYYKSKHERYKSHQIPYTILMPPPLPKTENTRPTTEPTSVTIQQSSLIYHSSTLSDLHAEPNLQSIRDEQDSYHTADSTSVTWRTPLAPPSHHQNNHQHEYKKPSAAAISMTTYRPVTEQMYKMGKVENANMDAINTYVNIGKSEAHIQADNIPQQNNLINLLKKEITNDPKEGSSAHTNFNLNTNQNMNLNPNPNLPATMTSFLANIPKATTRVYTTTTQVPPSTTTMANTLTTDPLFKHYKQPNEPLRGPMYLIIQGHSKVKTYGPAKQLFGINVQEINEIPNYDNYKEFQVKHLHTYRKKEEYIPTHRNGRARDLSTLAELAQAGYGAIDNIEVEDGERATVGRNDEDIKETELVAGFEVAPAHEDNVEVYHKGFVDDGEDNVSTTENSNIH